MKRVDFVCLSFLVVSVIIIFFPVFHAEYLYTDDAPQLWLFGKDLNFQASVPQGRYVTYRLFLWLFSYIHTVHDVIYARLFSLAGWIVCLPVWYFIINKLVFKNGFPKTLGLLSLVYLVCIPPFAISIGWAACLELFIACTSGLIAGYVLYDGIRYRGTELHLSNISMSISLAFGLLSLFTYQNGFGCFFLPFLIHFISTKKITRPVRTGVLFSLFVYAVYFLLFRYTLRINGLETSGRSDFATNPIRKAGFFFTRPLASAFHFTWIFNENSIPGIIVYIIIAATWLITCLYRWRSGSLWEKSAYLGGMFVLLVLIYLPSMIVQENYSSNRTLLALDLAVFFLVAESVFSLLADRKLRNIVTGVIAGLFLINAWYNFNKQFQDPLAVEYNLIKNYITDHYEPGTKIVYMVRPAEDAFEKEYGIVRSWDEFGAPSTAKIWTAESLVKQLIFEKTGDRSQAEAVVVKSGLSQNSSPCSQEMALGKTLLIDVKKMLAAP